MAIYASSTVRIMIAAIVALVIRTMILPTFAADHLTWKRRITVDQSSGRYRTIQAAIDSIPSGNRDYVLIRVMPGMYKEKVVIPADKPHVIVTGKSAETTVITWSDHGDIHQSPTFTVLADNFVGRYLTFQNTHGRGDQAVALRVKGDMVSFYACKMLSYQDTLLVEVGRQFYSSCYIEGEVDFIFGTAASIFKNCHIRSLSQGDAAITAQKRESSNDKGGFYFVGCKITGVKSCVLGRPWGPYSRVVFAHTYMSSAVLPQGWDDWNKPKTRSTVYYGEYMCSGPGANRSKRVAWSHSLSNQQASPFMSTSVIQGNRWIRT